MNLSLVRMVLWGVGLCGLATAGAAGCSTSSSSGGASFSCPAVGSTACPKDPANPQTAVNACQMCTTQGSAWAICDSSYNKPRCGADGTSQQYSNSGCASQYNAFVMCVTKALGGSSSGGSSSSGGEDGGEDATMG